MTQPKKGYLRSVRQDAGLTQAALAALIQTSPTTLSAYETGARPVPPEMVATIEAVCFARSEPPAPSLATPHHAPPGPEPHSARDAEWRAALNGPLQDIDAPDQPLIVVDRRERRLESVDDTPPVPSSLHATYTVVALEPLAKRYARTVTDEEAAVALYATLHGFLLFLEREETEARAVETFTAACRSLLLTGDVAQYTRAVLVAQEAGLSPARITDRLRQTFRSMTEPAPTLLHEGNAPWLREGAAHVSR